MSRLANMLSSIKNVSYTDRESIEVLYTSLCEEVAKVLKKAGYVKELKVFKEGATKMLRLDLAKPGTKIDVRMLSTSGNRDYRGYNELGKIHSFGGSVVVSTSRGVMEAREARNKKLGGEVICIVF